MNVVRVPLAELRGVDLSSIQGAAFLFPPDSEGEIMLDDLRFTR